MHKYNWLKNRTCPHCNNKLAEDWVWASTFDNFDQCLEDWQDYSVWFLVCDECEKNFIDEDGEIVECNE